MTLNQRLDQMGPHYRAICGRLHRAVAMIEHAAGSNPPNMSLARLEAVIRMIVETGADLEEAYRALKQSD
jgi:hypothetical protein